MCKKCVLTSTFPNIFFNHDGICNYCVDESVNENLTSKKKHYATKQEFVAALEKYKKFNKSEYDVLIPISGGVDSSVALIEIVNEFDLKPLCFHNDHGYESENSTSNARKLCKKLNVDLVIVQHNYQFMKKLWKYGNISSVIGLNTCFICGNIIYANALELASKYNISLIVNGYSKGQVQLIEDESSAISLISSFIREITENGDNEFVEYFLKKMNFLKKQKKYSSTKDLEKVCLDKILVIPFYSFDFYKTDKVNLKNICQEYFDWRTEDHSYPSRTTNCIMNWINNYYDFKKRGYSNYHAEYSVLIRKNEMTREQALKDLEFHPPEGLLEKLANDINVIL
jgi:tRNA(Ile)-lysidine synthase TilS/MesJ